MLAEACSARWRYTTRLGDERVKRGLLLLGIHHQRAQGQPLHHVQKPHGAAARRPLSV